MTDFVLADDELLAQVEVAVSVDTITDSQNAKAIQDAIYIAKPGDTVKLNTEYDITNSNITIIGKK